MSVFFDVLNIKPNDAVRNQKYLAKEKKGKYILLQFLFIPLLRILIHTLTLQAPLVPCFRPRSLAEVENGLWTTALMVLARKVVHPR
jgi:hypothetical protein